MWIIIHGNPIEGFAYHGVWETEDEAFSWAMAEYDQGDDFWATKIIIANPDFNEPDEFADSKAIDVSPEELERIIAQAQNQPKMPRQVMVDLSEIPA